MAISWNAWGTVVHAPRVVLYCDIVHSCAHISRQSDSNECAWQIRPEDLLEPAETPEEATRRMLDAKKLSSKINYNVLANLFNDTRAEP
jgi:hypothetical protein